MSAYHRAMSAELSSSAGRPALREVEGAGDHAVAEPVLGADDVPGEIEGGLADVIRAVVALVERDRLDDPLRDRLLGLERCGWRCREGRAPGRVEGACAELYTRIMRYA